MKPHVIYPAILFYLILLAGVIFAQECTGCQLLSSITNGPAEFVKVKNNIAYFDNGINLEIVDFSDPANPVELLKEQLGGIAIDLELVDSLLYYALNTRELLIMDIRRPFNSPITIAKIVTNIPIRDVEVVDSILYILTWNEFEFYNISDPANPVLLGVKNFERDYRFFSISGGYAYLVNFNDSLYVWNMNGLDSAGLVNVVPVEINTGNVTTIGNYAYVTSPFGLKVLDISDRMNPVLVSGNSQSGNDFIINNGKGFLCSATHVVYMFDATDPAHLVYENMFYTEGPARHSFVENGKIYVAEDHQGVSVTDLSNTQFLGRFDTWGRTRDVIAEGNFLYVANGNDGLRVFDVSDPTNPSEIGVTGIDGRLEYFDKYGNKIYSCDNSSGKMKVIDVSDPASPAVIESCNINSYMNDIAVNDSLIFISTRDSGVVILDRYDCSRKLSSYSTGSNIWSARSHNNLLYCIDENKMFYVLDISDPEHPVENGYLDLQSTSLKMDIVGDTVFIASYYHGCIIVDVSNPGHPAIITEYNPGLSEMRDIKVIGDFAYIANGYHGLTVLNISNTDSIYQVANYDKLFDAWGIDAQDNIAYIANVDGGFYIIKNDMATDIQNNNYSRKVDFYLAQNYPNPFNPTTKIKYSVMSGKKDRVNIKLVVYDVLGRVIATLVNEEKAPGEYIAEFNASGLPSGIYYYKLQEGEFIQSRAMVLIK